MRAKREKKQEALDLALAKRLYGMGLSDKEIAHCCCVSTSTVLSWRRAHGLQPNPETARATGPNEQLAIDAAAARNHGMTYGKYMAQKPALLAAMRGNKE